MTDPQKDYIKDIAGDLDMDDEDVEDLLSDDYGYDDILWPDDYRTVSGSDASEVIEELKTRREKNRI